MKIPTLVLAPTLALALASCGGDVTWPVPGPMPAEAATLAADQPQVVSLTAEDPHRFFRLPVADGTLVEVAATNRRRGDASVYVALLHADQPATGERVLTYRYAHAREGVDSISLRRTISAEEAGEYALFVQADEPSEVELTLRTSRQRDAGREGDSPADPAAARPIELATTYDGATGDLDLHDTYHLTVPANGRLTVSTTNTARTAFPCNARLLLDGQSRHVEYVEPGEETTFTVEAAAGAAAVLDVGCNGEATYRFTIDLESV